MDARSSLARATFPCLALALVGCAGAGVLAPFAVKIGKNILSAALGNYGSGYSDVVNDFFSVLERTTEIQRVGAPPLIAASTAPGTGAGNTGASRGPDNVPTSESPLEVEFELVREVVIEGRATLARIADGDVLRDGRGDPDGGDNFKVLVRPRQECWIYLVAVDATGWVQPVYPFGFVPGDNPVTPGREMQIPAREWLFLDEYRGVETFYLLVSREQNLELEATLSELSKQVRPASAELRVEEAEVFTSRGIAGVRPGRETYIASRSDPGATLSIEPSSFFVEASESQLLLTRWFRHE